ncbi:MAG: adenylate/guanylate cyclase domain-containing protein [Pseudomonadota bacterium]
MSVCPSCSTENPAGARFCNQCGAKLEAVPAAAPKVRDYTPRHLAEKILKTRAAIQGEKKRVTVLFCDIKGSTKLAEQAGPERWHGILDEFFKILTGAVHKFEGTVNQYTGDGIMALFGAPISHEDHAQRACFSALEMQRALRQFADRLRLQEGLNLTLRVGLNTGEVIVGRIGDDLRMDYTAQGLTVNLAARMEHICEPGHIYLTRGTAMLAEGYFKLRSLGAMEIAGSSVPIEVFDLEGEGELKTRLQRGLARGNSPFVGREKELALLNAALDRTKAGEGSVMAVVGNAGIGKSRLSHEFAESAARSGLTVHRATGVPYAGALPLFPVQTLIKSRLGLPEFCKIEDARRLVAGTFLLQDAANAALVPAILEFLGYVSAGAAAPDAAAATREKLFELFVQWLPRADSPQLLLVEDVHFADTATEDFLKRLAQAARGTPTLLLFNFRPDYINEWLIPHLDEQIALSALTATQLQALTQALLGTHASLEGVAATITTRANGNPYYAEEAINALAEGGYIEGERSAYVLKKPIREWRIPDTIHALIAARIDRLPDEHKSLLQSAAVIGQDFRPELLSQLVQLQADPFEDSLAVLEETGFVHQKAEARERHYQFCHPLVQEVAYQAQLEAHRAVVHARLAQTLEAQYPATAAPHEAWMQIAHHWRRAGDWMKAGQWSLLAARYALVQDIAQAVSQMRYAEENFARAPFSDAQRKGRIAALAGLVRAAQFADMPETEVVAAYENGLKLAEECGDVACMAEMKLSYGVNLLNRGDAEASVRLTAEAVELCKQNNAPQLIHRFRLAILLPFNSAGLPAEGIRQVDAGGTEWRTGPVTQDNFASRAFYGLMLTWMGRFKEAEINILGGLREAEKEDRGSSWMHANLVDFAWFTGRYELALPHARQAIEHAEKFGSPYFIAVALRSLGLAHGLNRDFATAARLMEPGIKLVSKGAQAYAFESNFLATLSRAYLGMGQVEKAADTAQAALASAQRSKSKVWEISAWVSLLQLPPQGPWAARAEEGLARLDELITATSAEGYRPWALLCRARWTKSADQRAGLRQQAHDAFLAMGAPVHAKNVKDRG